MLTNAPWFVPKAIIRNDLSVTTIRQEVKKIYNKFSLWLYCWRCRIHL